MMTNLKKFGTCFYSENAFFHRFRINFEFLCKNLKVLVVKL